MPHGREVFSTANAEALLQKIDGVFVSGTTDGTVNTETVHAHELGRIPRGFVIISQDKAGSIYNSNNAHDADEIKIKAGADAGAVTIAFVAYVF